MAHDTTPTSRDVSVPALSDAGLAVGGGSSDLAEFPDEVPSEKQLKDWLDDVDPTVRRTYGALLRGDTPADLVSTKATAERDLTGYMELPVPAVGSPAAAGMPADRVITHNHRVRGMHIAKASAQTVYDRSIAEMKDRLAQLLVTSMRPRATNRLIALLAKHKVADNLHDGCVMYLELVALQGSTGMHEEVRDHDREIEKLRDTPLPDGCAVQEFSDYVNAMHDHLPHLERPLTCAALDLCFAKHDTRDVKRDTIICPSSRNLSSLL